MTIEIEKVEIQKVVRKRAEKYPFSKMEVGESFHLEYKIPNATLHAANKRHFPAKFRTIPVGSSDSRGCGFRIVRVE